MRAVRRLPDPLATYDLGFEYDNGYGLEFVAHASVEIRHDAVEQEPYPHVVALDVEDTRGNEASYHIQRCCAERAEELAWARWTATQTGE